MWKKILFGIGAVAVIALFGIYGAFYQPDIPRTVLEAKYAGAPSQFVVLRDGARVHYRDRGPREAPVLVLLHGSNSSLFDWEPWSKSLSNWPPDADKNVGYVGIAVKAQNGTVSESDKALLIAQALSAFHLDRYRVISVDLPGHGLTGAVPNSDYSEQGMTVFVKEFADKLGLGRFAVGGNSMGGGVAARFAEEYPDRVTHLIVVDGAGMQTSFGDRLPLAFRLARTPVLNHLLLHITPRSLVVEGLNDAIVRRTALTDTMIDEYWDFARMAGTREATIARFRQEPDNFVRDHIGTLKAPTLILWGSEDRLIPVAAAHAWAKAIPGAKLIVYPDTGHLPMEEDATESAGDVRAFLGAMPR